MHIALYQSYLCHTEVFGFILDALRVMYPQYTLTVYLGPGTDTATFIPFYEELFGLTLTIKPCYQINSDIANIDKVIMITVDDPIDHAILYAHPDKFVLIEHERTWFHTSMPCHTGLSPYTATPFVFPVYAQLPPERPVPTVKPAARLHLAVVGHVTSSQNSDEMRAFLNFSPHTRLTFFSRQYSHEVNEIQTTSSFTGRVRVKTNLSTKALISSLKDNDIDGVWAPVRKNGIHSTIKLTGALPLSYNIQKLLIVPDILATSYCLEGAVVYDNGVDGLLLMMQEWDARSEEDWKHTAEQATAFVQRTVCTNLTLLRRMIEDGVGGRVPV